MRAGGSLPRRVRVADVIMRERRRRVRADAPRAGRRQLAKKRELSFVEITRGCTRAPDASTAVGVPRGLRGLLHPAQDVGRDEARRVGSAEIVEVAVVRHAKHVLFGALRHRAQQWLDVNEVVLRTVDHAHRHTLESLVEVVRRILSHVWDGEQADAALGGSEGDLRRRTRLLTHG